MEIAYLPKDDSIIRTLATWIYNEWLRPYPNASVERMISILSERAESIELPLTMVALSDAGVPVGVASLQLTEMKTRPRQGPWLSGAYVLPEQRGKGIGSALCERIAKEAKRLGFPEVYLYTKDQQRLYSRLGWQAIAVERYNEMEVTVMRRPLSE